MDGIVERVGVFALVGLSSGFVSGLFGIGGGIVRIPLFVYLLPLFGVPHPVMMHLAVGTSMALVLPSAIASTRKQLVLGNLDLKFFRTWALGILVGVLIGTALLPYASTEILQVIFALFMLTVGVYEGLLKDRLVIAPAAPQRSEEHTSELQSPCNLVCRLLLEKKKQTNSPPPTRKPTIQATQSLLN